MKRTAIRIMCLAITACAGMAISQTNPSGETAPGGDPWPRKITTKNALIQIYQPQLESWTGNLLTAYAAVAIDARGSDDKSYGVVWFTARTEVDKINRLVTLDQFKVTKSSFPSLPGNGSVYMGSLTGDLPPMKTIPLDILEASLATTSAAESQKKYELKNDPPRIIVSLTPAVLALIDGQPALHDVGEHLQKIINTRSLIFFDSLKQVYYLALMDAWVQAKTLDGPWMPADHEPKKDLERMKKAALENNQNQILGNPEQSLKDAEKEGEAPTVYVSTTPADLLLTQGEPQLTPIPGTNLLYVKNSGADIFMDDTNQTYYVLISGRWFSSMSLQNGTWAYVAGTALPGDFAKIPIYNPKASVLVSVPGTPQAKEALIANQIPQTATISRTAAKLEVTYYGAPDFKPIEGTEMTYAVNTNLPVINVPGNTYFAVQNAVWFSSANAAGPWAVATTIPPVIYTIPPSSPIHYVTYVQIYGATPTSVYTGYTPGYYGTVVSSDGVVVYGTGWAYPPYIAADIWVPPPYTYGVGAAFSWSAAAGWGLGFGLGMAIGAECGPWWGPVGGWGWGYAAPAWGWGGYGGAAAANVYGRWGNTAFAGTRAAWANPYTGNIGTAARGSYYNPVTGNTGVAARGENYNAYTGTSSRGAAASGYNPTTGRSYSGEAARASNPYTGNYAAGVHDSTYDARTGIAHGGSTGIAGNAYSGQAALNSRGYTYNTNTGNGIGHADGNVYADHDGNVYRANPSSGWQQHTSSGWSSAPQSMHSSLDSAQSARSSGEERWGGFHSGGWGGHFGGGGLSDRGSWGGSGGFGGGGRFGAGFRR